MHKAVFKQHTNLIPCIKTIRYKAIAKHTTSKEISKRFSLRLVRKRFESLARLGWCSGLRKSDNIHVLEV